MTKFCLKQRQHCIRIIHKLHLTNLKGVMKDVKLLVLTHIDRRLNGIYVAFRFRRLNYQNIFKSF